MQSASVCYADVLSPIAYDLQKRMFAADFNDAFHSTTRLAALGEERRILSLHISPAI